MDGVSAERTPSKTTGRRIRRFGSSSLRSEGMLQGRNDLPAAMGFALADRMVKAEIDSFNARVAERFGERAFLSIAAREVQGSTFEKAALGLPPGEKQKLVSAWPMLRAGQQLAAHERTARALKEAESLRQSQRQGQTLK